MTAPTRLLQCAARARARRRGDIGHDLVVFVALLREVGVPASTSGSIAALGSLDSIRIECAGDFRSALGCCLTHSIEERAAFDAVYDLFWTAENTAALTPETEEPTGDEGDGGTGQTGPAGTPDLAVAPDRPASRNRATQRATYSPAPATRSRPHVARQLRDVDALARRLARALGSAPGRQQVLGGTDGPVDLRDSMRHNVRFGSELIELRHAHPRQDRARIVVLCDVSSSMRPYTALFLAFIHAIARRIRRAETAVFNVELSVVTDLLRRCELRPAMAELHRQEVALSGGTRIGHCLHDFLDEMESRGALRPRTHALILSDGWDVGDPRLLEASMRRLRDQVGRVVWCDPHAAASDYRPQVRGLRAALPYVDDHLDFQDLNSLSELVSRLEHPARRHRSGGLRRPNSPMGRAPQHHLRRERP